MADVAIVGAGPTGIVLSILLAQRGHSVVLLERQPTPYPLPRAVAIDAEIARVLQSCGIGEGLRAHSEPAETYEWRNATGSTLLKFVGKGDGPSGWPQTLMVNQPMLERLLTARLDLLPNVTVRRGHDVVGLEQHNEGVTVRYRRDYEDSLDARYVIGADGANSSVRLMLDIPVEDLGFFYDWLVVDVIPNEPRTYDPINLQICDPTRPTTLVSGGPGRRRWEFMRLPHEDPAELSGEGSAWRLLEPWDIHPGNAVLERSANYTFRARWAQQWRSGRVLLAGDAAHQMPPFAGQGMCSGLRDAANLAWKLDLVLSGKAPDTLLDSYGTERMPNVRAVIGFSIELGKVICIPDANEAAARDEFMIAALEQGGQSMGPPLPGVGEGDGGILEADSPEAGSVFIQGTVATGNGTPLPFDDAAGIGFRLITAGPIGGTVPADLLAWFASIGGRIVDFAPAGGLTDHGGTYGRWLAKHGAFAVLQRPDFYVYGTAAAAGDVPALLEGLRSRLGATDR
jgi:flavoprotein hydroxylase